MTVDREAIEQDQKDKASLIQLQSRQRNLSRNGGPEAQKELGKVNAAIAKITDKRKEV